MPVTIYHNPKCGTSRNTLAILRDAGIEPTIIEYLKTPFTREKLESLVEKMPISLRDLMRQRGTPFEELGLGDESLSDAQLIDAMLKHPILMERPVVETDKGVRLCRPAETVKEIL